MAKDQKREQALPEKSFVDGLTNWEKKKSTILKACIFFAVYIVVGGFIYNAWFEETSFIDAIYFTSITASTVGYGDVVPTTDGQKLFTTFYLLLGVIVVLGMFVTILVDDLFDSVNNARDKIMSTKEDHIIHKVEGGTKPLPEFEKRFLAYWRVMIFRIPYILACFLPPIVFAIVENNTNPPTAPQWNWVDVIYYTVVTATTIGYGDVFPRNQWVRLVCVFYVPFCVIALTMVMSAFSNVYMSRKTDETEQRFLQRKLRQKDLIAMDIDMNDTVTRAEFFGFMFVMMGKCEPEFIEKLSKVFNRLDKDNNGTLTMKDLLRNLDHPDIEDDDDDNFTPINPNPNYDDDQTSNGESTIYV
mmetsp:Transcript_17204/g.26068  ORF Transcript_17204/g.26068 Transcript_17204/m.26068 type:complete len:358 (+) Transcript_17204:83-1156(+)